MKGEGNGSYKTLKWEQFDINWEQGGHSEGMWGVPLHCRGRSTESQQGEGTCPRQREVDGEVQAEGTWTAGGAKA